MLIFLNWIEADSSAKLIALTFQHELLVYSKHIFFRKFTQITWNIYTKLILRGNAYSYLAFTGLCRPI